MVLASVLRRVEEVRAEPVGVVEGRVVVVAVPLEGGLIDGGVRRAPKQTPKTSNERLVLTATIIPKKNRFTSICRGDRFRLLSCYV